MAPESGKIKEINDSDEFEEAIKNHPNVIVDFYANWCGPCKQLTPVLDELANQYQSQIYFIKVNADEADWVGDYGVSALPTILFFHNGEKQETVTGNNPNKIKEVLKRLYLETP